MKLKTPCFVNKVLVVVCVIAASSFVSGQGSGRNSNEDSGETKEPEPPVDQHTFVALIDIVFTDGSRKTCTGTIIHDYVVITAAHCFVSDRNKKSRPELTTSFVVIGTKNMFETGYEQYLPIERVVTHPKFEGWTADLSLVFTFAGMTSDKPGTVISLAGDKTSTPVDSNVTVLSWGHSKDDPFNAPKHKKKKPKKEVEICSSSESGEHGNENVYPGTQSIPEALRAGRPFSSSEEITRDYHRPKKHTKKTIKKKRTVRTTRTYRTRFKTVKQNQIQRFQIDLDEYRDRSEHLISRYLSQRQQGNLTKTVNDDKQGNNEELKTENSSIKNDIIRKDLNVSKEKTQEESQNIKLHYKNWRRRMGPQQNKLTVEVFGFVNMQTCKKVVENAMPEIYEIKGVTDIVCYASDEHLITAEDSGAPAIRHGQLVAVTVGGGECDGDHVAVGMKMSCYCSWIAANLPPGGPRMQCCRNCCDVTHGNEKNSPPRHRNKYLL